MRHIINTILFLISYNLIGQSCPQLSTYFGKSQFDEFKSVCIDNKGNIYAVGNTYNNDLPVTTGAFQMIYKSSYESFIVKFDSCGSLIWCTYLGTQGFDSAERISFSNDSSIVITGYTNGTDLPTTIGCFQPTMNIAMYDCFLAKFNLNGQPRWITYFGGTQSDFSYALSIDKDNNIIIGGTSLSPTIYTTPQSFQQNIVGATDAFIAKFSKTGQLKFSTFYGGNSSEDIHDITTDIDGNIIATGGSFSFNLNTSASCFQSNSNGGMEIYVIKLDSIGNRIFSTYIGGSSQDDAYGVCVDTQKNIYLTGHTNSFDFYKTAISHQTTIVGSSDNFCLKLTPLGNLLWSNIFGGSSFDANVHSKIDANNQIVSLINTDSPDFPMLGTGNFTTNTGSGDIVLVKISSNGQLNWSTYRGGSFNETSTDLLLMNNKIVISGSSTSNDFPVISNNFQVIKDGQEDGFLTTVSASVSVVYTSLKEIHPNKCITNWDNKNSNLRFNCEVEYVRIYDLLGRTIDVYNLSSDQLYIVIGYDRTGSVLFAQKILTN